MRRSQQAFSVPSKQTQSSNAKDELTSTASINASSTTLIPSSKRLASKPRDCTLKREQNSCYEHDNGLNSPRRLDMSGGFPAQRGHCCVRVRALRRVSLDKLPPALRKCMLVPTSTLDTPG